MGFGGTVDRERGAEDKEDGGMEARKEKEEGKGETE